METKKHKILFVTESLAAGGAEKVLSVLVRNLDKKRFDVSVCSLVDVGIYRDEIRKAARLYSLLPDSETQTTFFDRYIYKFRYKSLYNLLPASVIAQKMAVDKYDTVIAFMEGFSTKIVSRWPDKHTRKLAWIHTDLRANPWTLKKQVFGSLKEERSVFEKFDQIIAVSHTVLKSFVDLYRPSVSTTVLYNPIEVNRICELSKESFYLNPKGDKLRFVSVGRLEEQKGYDRLIEVVHRIPTPLHRFEVLIVGDGSERERLTRMIEKYQLGDCVKLVGFHKNPYPYILQSDLFICSSRAEGYSTVVNESLILGIPVLATECSGMRELFTDEKEGRIVENSEAGLLEAFTSILEHPDVLGIYKEACATRRDDFATHRFMNPIEKLLENDHRIYTNI